MKFLGKRLIFLLLLALLMAVGVVVAPRLLREYQFKRYGIPQQAERDNPFISGSDKLKVCMKQAIGEKAFNDIAQNKRPPTDDEIRSLEPCFQSEMAIEGKGPQAPTKDFFTKDLVNPAQLTRNHPEFMVCEYVSEMDVVMVAFEQLERFKEAGLNTVCIYLNPPRYSPYMSSKDKQADWRILKIKWAVGKIKKAGMAVLLDQDVGSGSKEGEILVTRGTSDELLSEMERENLMWAKVAEEYKIEYFSPFGEIEDKLDWFLEKEGLTTQKRIAKTNRWLSQLLPKLRKAYKGRLIAHYGRLYPQLDPTGYDYFGSTIDVGSGATSMGDPTNLNDFRRRIRTVFRIASAIEEKTKSEWLIPETFFAYEEPNVGPDIQQYYETYGQQLKELQDDYFRITFEEILKLTPEKRPRGIEIGGYVLDMGGYGSMTFSPFTKETRSEIRKFLSQV